MGPLKTAKYDLITHIVGAIINIAFLPRLGSSVARASFKGPGATLLTRVRTQAMALELGKNPSCAIRRFRFKCAV